MVQQILTMVLVSHPVRHNSSLALPSVHGPHLSSHGLRCQWGLGLPHGHRLLGQEVRLHVGRRQQRHVRPQGAPGNTNISVNSEE